MRVVEFREYGGPEVLRLAERPDPEPAGGEVRVRVRYSGVNRADLLQRRGRYPTPAGFPADIPGLEFAGTVELVGEGCGLRAVGDRVMGVIAGGGYADKVVVPERQTIRIPEGMSAREAGAVPEVFMTAWDALFLQAGLKAGETLLIHAVGSGVGTAALHLAQAAGVRTVGTTRTADKLDRALGMGLDAGVLAGRGADWADEVLKRSERGVDVILDLVGARYMEGNQRVLARRGRWMVVGVPSGNVGKIDLRHLMGRRASVTGTVLRARPVEERIALAREFERTLVPLFESQSLRAVVDRSFPAAETARAHRYMEENRSFGAIVLAWDHTGAS